MNYPLLKKIQGAQRVSVLMNSVLVLLADMGEDNATHLERFGEVTMALHCEEMAETMAQLTGQRIVQLENCLDVLGDVFGFGVDFLVTEAEFKLRVVALPQDDDQPPIDGDDDTDPVHEIENVDVIEAVFKPKAMSAHG